MADECTFYMSMTDGHWPITLDNKKFLHASHGFQLFLTSFEALISKMLLVFSCDI